MTSQANQHITGSLPHRFVTVTQRSKQEPKQLCSTEHLQQLLLRGGTCDCRGDRSIGTLGKLANGLTTENFNQLQATKSDFPVQVVFHSLDDSRDKLLCIFQPTCAAFSQPLGEDADHSPPRKALWVCWQDFLKLCYNALGAKRQKRKHCEEKNTKKQEQWWWKILSLQAVQSACMSR